MFTLLTTALLCIFLIISCIFVLVLHQKDSVEQKYYNRADYIERLQDKLRLFTVFLERYELLIIMTGCRELTEELLKVRLSLSSLDLQHIRRTARKSFHRIDELEYFSNPVVERLRAEFLILLIILRR